MAGLSGTCNNISHHTETEFYTNICRINRIRKTKHYIKPAILWKWSDRSSTEGNSQTGTDRFLFSSGWLGWIKRLGLGQSRCRPSPERHGLREFCADWLLGCLCDYKTKRFCLSNIYCCGPVQPHSGATAVENNGSLKQQKAIYHKQTFYISWTVSRFDIVSSCYLHSLSSGGQTTSIYLNSVLFCFLHSY